MGFFKRSTPDPPDSKPAEIEVTHRCTCGDSFSTAEKLISHAQSVHGIEVD